MGTPAGKARGGNKEPQAEKVPEELATTFPSLARAVADALQAGVDHSDPLRLARGCGDLLEALHQQVLIVQARRDAALMEVLRSPLAISHYTLARELGMSRQRVDQLAARLDATGGVQEGE